MAPIFPGRLLPGVVTEGNRARRALADGLAHRILEFRWHLADHHDGVAVVVQFEHLGAEPQADPETGARRYSYLPTFILRGLTHINLEFDPVPGDSQ